MKISHHVIANGHFVDIDTPAKSLSVRTDSGTPKELMDYAADLRAKAARLVENADLIEAAAHVVHCEKQAS